MDHFWGFWPCIILKISKKYNQFLEKKREQFFVKYVCQSGFFTSPLSHLNNLDEIDTEPAKNQMNSAQLS